MTGYTVHTGSSLKFSQGWDQIFQGKTSGKGASTARKQTAKSDAESSVPKSQKKSRKSK